MRWIARLFKIFSGRCVGKRTLLPNCRKNIHLNVPFDGSRGRHRTYDVCFGLDDDNIVREVFCDVAKTGTELQDLVHDACIAASIALQFGARIGELAHSMCELREENELSGPPASPLGAIACAGAALEAELAGGRG
jgi:hypothetical protein